jgi:hypothetical protein
MRRAFRKKQMPLRIYGTTGSPLVHIDDLRAWADRSYAHAPAVNVAPAPSLQVTASSLKERHVRLLKEFLAERTAPTDGRFHGQQMAPHPEAPFVLSRKKLIMAEKQTLVRWIDICPKNGVTEERLTPDEVSCRLGLKKSHAKALAAAAALLSSTPKEAVLFSMIVGDESEWEFHVLPRAWDPYRYNRMARPSVSPEVTAI